MLLAFGHTFQEIVIITIVAYRNIEDARDSDLNDRLGGLSLVFVLGRPALALGVRLCVPVPHDGIEPRRRGDDDAAVRGVEDEVAARDEDFARGGDDRRRGCRWR